jgi:hypothetical protein
MFARHVSFYPMFAQHVPYTQIIRKSKSVYLCLQLRFIGKWRKTTSCEVYHCKHEHMI